MQLKRGIIYFIIFSGCTYISTPLVIAQAKEFDESIERLTDDFLDKNPTEALAIIDSLITEVRKSQKPMMELKLLALRRTIPEWSYQSDKIIKDLDRRILLSKNNDLDTSLADLYLSKATFSARLGKTEQVMTILDSVKLYLSVSPKKGQIKTKAQINYLKGRILDRSGRLEEAMEFYLKTIEEAEKINYDLKIMDVYFQLGFVHRALRNWDQAIINYEKSLEYSFSLNDTTYMVYNYVFIAGALLELIDEKKMKKERQELLKQVNQKLETASSLALNRNDPYELELLFYEQANYFEAISDYKNAIAFIKKSRDESRKAGNVETEMAGYAQAAVIYNKAGEYSKAAEEAKLGIDLANRIGAYYYLANFYEEVAKSAEKQNDITTAYEYFKKYVVVRDSVFRQENADKVNELQTKYDTEKKETEIENLKQQAQIQTLEIKQRKQITYFTIAASFLVMLIAYIVYRQRDLVKRRKQVELEYRFLRSQLNPHFIFNVLGAIQNFILSNNAIKASEYLTNFAKMIRKVLEHSRTKFVEIDNEIELLRNYIELQILNYESSFSYNLDYESIEDKEIRGIPSMIIQPFVENAIEHGIGENGGHLEVKFIELSNDLLQINVIDDGLGFQSQKYKNSLEHKSMSLDIINEQLAILRKEYNSDISFNISPTDNENNTGTTIKLILPTIEVNN